MKTLYTGHVTIDQNYVYSFIYAETLLEAEQHLAVLLENYVSQFYDANVSVPRPRVNIVSRPNGWEPPDGYYLPGTSRQYALKYPSQRSSELQKADVSASDRDLATEDVVPFYFSQSHETTV